MYVIEEKLSSKMESPISTALYSIRHYNGHYHDDILEIIYCLDGEINIRSAHRVITLHKGEILTLDPGDIHCLWSETDNVILITHIDINKLTLPIDVAQICFFACESAEAFDYQLESLHEIKQVILSLAFANAVNMNIPCSADTRLAMHIMDLMIRKFDWLSFMWDPYFENKILKERFYKIIEFCAKNYSQNITLKQMAKKEQISENYLSLFLKKMSFGGFRNMLGYIRCFNAERMLLTTNDTALNISHKCGFSDPKYFYKYFNHMWSETPNQLRKWYHNFGAMHDVSTLERNRVIQLLKDEIVTEQLLKYSLISNKTSNHL